MLAEVAGRGGEVGSDNNAGETHKYARFSVSVMNKRLESLLPSSHCWKGASRKIPKRLRATSRRRMNDSGGGREARESSETMRDAALIFPACFSPSLPFPCLLREDDAGDRAFGLRRLVRQIAIATASLITGSRVLDATFHPRVPRRTEGSHASGTPGMVVTRSAHSCPAISDRAVSCRTCSLTLDTVRSIQRDFSIARTDGHVPPRAGSLAGGVRSSLLPLLREQWIISDV